MPDSDDAFLKELEQLAEGSEEAEAPTEQPDADSGDKGPSEEVVSEKDAGSTEPYLELDGQKYTAKDLKELRSGSLRYADYTKKTQALAAERKKWEEEKAKWAAERSELDEWRRIDRIISSDKDRLEAFRKLWQSANLQEPAKAAPAIPDDIRDKLEALEAAEEERKVKAELEEVMKLVGNFSLDEQNEFLQYVENMQEKVDGEIPLVLAAKTFPPFFDRLVEKAVQSRMEDKSKREADKSKTKGKPSGKKQPAAPKSYSDAMLEELEQMYRS